jgi:hypothetical protein
MNGSRVVALLAAIPLAAVHGAAQQKVDARYQLDVDGAVRIHNYNGTITIRGWDRDTVRVTGTIAGKGVYYGGGRGKGVKLGVDGSSDAAPLAELTVVVPTRARVMVRGAATAIAIRDFAGAIDATALSGPIRIAGAAGEVLAETMDGDLEVEASPSLLRARTAMGRIAWTGSSDDVSLVTVGGTITVTAGTVYHARVESVSGDVKFTGGIKPRGRATFETHGGDVTLALAAATRAELTADAPVTSVLGVVSVRKPGRSEPVVAGVPRGGALTGSEPPADLTARSFKGRVTVTQP